MDKQISLSKLSVSPLNVRKSTNEGIAALSENLISVGLLQRIIVAPNKSKKGHFLVTAGGRRLNAFKLAAESGKIKKTHMIDCKVFNGTEAEQSEISLSENFHRINMSTPDECVAFRHLVAEDRYTAQEIADRFGISIVRVKQRLRIADLHPDIFSAFADGKLTQDQAIAYASTEDTARQKSVFDQYSDYPAQTIRHKIKEGAYKSDEPSCLLVGEEAYLAAGGTIEQDLFSEDGPSTWMNPEIVDQLASEKIAEKVAEAKAKLGNENVEFVPAQSINYSYTIETGIEAISIPVVDISQENEGEISKLRKRQQELEALFEQCDDDDEEISDELNDEYDKTEEAIENLSYRDVEVSEQAQKEAIRFVLISKSGELFVDQKLYTQSRQKIDPETGNLVASTKSANGSKTEKKAAAKYSEKLLTSLAWSRSDMIAMHILHNPNIAYELMLFTMAKNSSYETGFNISKSGPSFPKSDIVRPLENGLDDHYQSLNTKWREKINVAEQFVAFQALSDQEKSDWMVWLVASSTQPSVAGSMFSNKLHDELGCQMEIKIRDFIEPNEDNFFSHIRKDVVLDIITGIGGTELSGRHAKSKKAALAKAASEITSGKSMLLPDQKENALAYVPEPLRFERPEKAQETSKEPSEATSPEATEEALEDA